MFNIIRHCEYERAKNSVDYKNIKTSTNDPTITRRKRFAQLMKTSRTARVHNFKEAISEGPIFIATQGRYKDDLPSYRYASGQVSSEIVTKDVVETTNDTTNNTTNNTTSDSNNGTNY